MSDETDLAGMVERGEFGRVTVTPVELSVNPSGGWFALAGVPGGEMELVEVPPPLVLEADENPEA